MNLWAPLITRIVSRPGLSRSGTYFGVIILGLGLVVSFFYGQNGLTQAFEDEKLFALLDLPFVPPLHRGEQPIVNIKNLSNDLQDSYSRVRRALNGEPFSVNNGRDGLFGGVFYDLVRRDFESLLPILRKLQEVRVLKAYENDSKERSWFQIVLFSEPETLHLVVYLEKEENLWQITGVDTASSNWEE